MYGYEDKKVERLAIRSKTLASMLAQEDLRVTFHSKAQTAYFNASARELVLPHWDMDNQYLVDMLVEHEVGHAIHSDGIDLANVPAELRGYVNILEDVRVDRLQRENYPGTKKDYFEAGKALIERDVFKLGEIDMNSALLIDRINLKSKIGLHIGVPFFSEAEKDFVVRAFATETVEDVLALANEIFEYDRERREEETEKEQESMRNDEGEGAEGEEGEPEYTESESSPEKDESRADEKNDKRSVEAEGENKEENNNSKDGEPSKEDGKEDGSSKKNTSESKEERKAEKTPSKERTEKEPPKPQTADALNDFERNAKKAEIYEDNNYVEVGNVPVDYGFLRADLFRKEVVEITDKMAEIPDYVAEHEKLYRDAIALLRKEFAVHRFARSTSSLKTLKGSIDTNALCLYKINENIFRKSITVEKNDNNHRIVFLVDNSGSMYGNEGIQTVLKQIVIFRRFCLEEKIPFHVVSFTSPCGEYGATEAVSEWFNRQKKIFEHIADSEYAADRTALLIEILNENDSNDYFNRLVAYIGLHRSSSPYSSYYNSFKPGMTPTNDALSRLYQWMVEMKKTMREDKLDLVILTDGEATDALKTHNNSFIIRDTITRREYTLNDIYGETTNRTYSRYIMPAFVVLKSLKEEKIVNCVVWYNYVNMRNFQGADFGWDAMRRIGKQIIKKYEHGMFYNAIITGIKKAVRANGVVCAKSPFDFIDIAYFFISPSVFQYHIENEIKKNPDADKSVFRAERKAAGIFKSLAGNCAKFLG